VSGTVAEVNDDLPESPDMLNEDPYGDGWMVKIEMSDTSDLDDLMTAAEYEEFVAQEKE
jgi:glycine cleavage system H protein